MAKGIAANDEYYQNWWQRRPGWVRRSVQWSLAAVRAVAVCAAFLPFLMLIVDGEHETSEHALLAQHYHGYLPVQIGLREGYFALGRVDFDDPYNSRYLLVPLAPKWPGFVEMELKGQQLVPTAVTHRPFFEMLLLFLVGWWVIARFIVRNLRERGFFASA